MGGPCCKVNQVCIMQRHPSAFNLVKDWLIKYKMYAVSVKGK